MYATETRGAGRRRRGVSLVAVSFFVVTAASFAVMAVGTTTSNYASTRSRLETQRAFYVAEGGVDFALAQLALNNLWAARNTTFFPTVLADGSFESGWRTLGANAGRFRVRATYAMPTALPTGWAGPGLPSGFDPFTPVVFANRATSKPSFARVLLEVTGEHGQSQKTVRANVKLEFKAYGAAIVCDAQQVPGSGSGKNFAISNAATVVEGANLFVYGGIRSNGGIFLNGTTTPLTTANAATKLSGFDGTVATNLYGTTSEIPDYTASGSPDQLFDFRRFKAAAAAGRGAVYNSLTAFKSAMNAANTAGTPLEGIIYVVVDCAVEGSDPHLDTTNIPGGINVKGTLVFDFINPPDKFYKVWGETPLRINAATLPANFSPSDPSTFATGYPPTITASKDPRGFDLTPYGYPSFEPDDDLPALMFQTGTLDIHEETNICGAVYGPSFVEVENVRTNRQYINGIIIAGAGAYVGMGKSGIANAQVIAFDPNCVDSLATAETVIKVPSIKNFLIGE